ncbi:MAG: hypothetical protein CVU39_18795 [Chloroflexi bacterium HGW-Chloroflexi-10]|nr:MAG: hypothetical protein CVU39_18795 [Chloroflexi bacterium HGW-Chloroflexi-10]
MDLQYTKDFLERAGVIFSPGLSQDEIQQIQRTWRFRFPPDLKAFLMFALPVSKGFIDWRQLGREQIAALLVWPYEGICFDIENDNFWLEEWGPHPDLLEEAFEIARKAVEVAPTLIPVCGHRYMPETPYESGNPIFSVYQTDIIYYGRDLANYLENEFGHGHGRETSNLRLPLSHFKYIEFWTDFC